MRKIIIDAGVGLPEEFIKKYEIEIVPVNIFSEEGEDFSEKNIEEIIDSIKKGKILKPSGISSERLIKVYRKNKDKKIISIHTGSTISGITDTVRVVAKKMKEEDIDINIIDTLTAGPAAGIGVFKNIDKLLDEKIPPEEIEKEIQEISKKTEMLLIIKNPKMLLRIRPVEGIKRVLKNPLVILKYIKSGGGSPLISLKLGSFKTLKFIVKGKDEVDEIIKFIKENYLKKKDKIIAFTFGCEREEDEKRMIEILKENFEGEIHPALTFPLWIASVGIGFIGVAFYKENEG
jgi:DegV family protein with EDD domain